jgi:hypothetical protein
VTPSGSHTVAYSDPISPEPTITATDSQPMTASTPSGLPAGLSLTGPTVSGNTSTWKITGTATGAPGTSNVTFSVSDGTYSSPVSVPVTVVPEQATATYMGDTAATGNPAAVRLAATVAEVADGSPGDLSLATVTFKEGSRTLCGPVAVSGGSAACNASLTPGAHTVTVAIGGRYTGSGTGHVAVTAPAPTPTPTPSPTPSPTPAPTPTPTPVAPVNAAVCSTPIALTNVSQHGKRVTIAGYAQSSLVGKRLALRAGKRTVGHATVHPDGSFSAKVKAPKGRHAGQTRYSARSGSQHSATVTLSRALTAGATSRLRGRLTGPHDARRKLAVVERTDCSGAQQVKRIRTDARGRFSLTIARPAANTIDVYVVRTASGRPAAKSLPVVVR